MPTTRAAREGPRAQHRDESYEDEHEYQDEYEDEPYYEDDEDDEDDEGDAPGIRPPPADGEVSTAGAAARAAVGQVGALTGKQPEGVTAIEPADGGWLVSVEVVEDRRIPSSADILAIYETAIDTAGTLTSYRRTRRYGRGHGDGGRD